MTENAKNYKPIASDSNETVQKGGKNKRKKKKKRSPILSAAIVFNIIIILVLITLALFTSFDEVTNVFGGGKVDIVLTEPNWKPNEALHIVPETVLDKDPYVTNNEDTAVYVFLEVTVPYGNIEIESNSGNEKGKGTTYDDAPLYKFGVLNSNNEAVFDTSYGSTVQQTNSGWLLLDSMPEKDTNNNVYKYVYVHVDPSTNKLIPLAKGVTTQYPLFNKIKLVNIDETYKGTTNYSVPVKAYGIQANFLTSDNNSTNEPNEVWEIIKGN